MWLFSSQSTVHPQLLQIRSLRTHAACRCATSARPRLGEPTFREHASLVYKPSASALAPSCLIESPLSKLNHNGFGQSRMPRQEGGVLFSRCGNKTSPRRLSQQTATPPSSPACSVSQSPYRTRNAQEKLLLEHKDGPALTTCLACCPLLPGTRHPPVTARPCQRVSSAPRRGELRPGHRVCRAGHTAHYRTYKCKCRSSKFPPRPGHLQDECPLPEKIHQDKTNTLPNLEITFK